MCGLKDLVSLWNCESVSGWVNIFHNFHLMHQYACSNCHWCFQRPKCGHGPTAFIKPAELRAQKKSLLKQTPIWDVCMLPMYICGCTPDANVETFWLFFHWQKIMVCHFYPPCNRSARIFCLYVIAVITFLKILSSIALQTLKWSHKLHIHLFMKNVFLSLCVCNKRHTYSALQMLSGVERRSRLLWYWWGQNFTIASCWI